jgi:hypothetical protein
VTTSKVPVHQRAARVLVPIAAVAALSAVAVVPARATPTIGTTAVTLSKQTVAGKDYIVSDITIAPTEAPAGTRTKVRSTASSSPVCSPITSPTAARTASTAPEQR